MTPAARLAAAIDLLDAILDGAAADRALTEWGRRNRFAGSRDRAAIADIVYDCLRCRRSLALRSGSGTGRGLVVGLAGDDPGLFGGTRHGPDPLTEAECAALARPRAAAPRPERLDYPDWLDAPLARALGDRLEPVMGALQARAPLDLRVNLAAGARADAAAALAAEGIVTEPLDDPAALRVTEGARALRRAQPYLDGRVEIQDVSSQKVARFAGARPGMRVLDYCAGGGGKSLALAMHMEGRGTLMAHDAAPQRMGDIGPRAARAGVDVTLLAPDRPGSPGLGCDLVLVDAPCSGSGAWRRNPDAKWRFTPAELARITALQDRVLAAAARHVAPGGQLVYATCSLLAEENADRVAAFLAGGAPFAAGETLTLTPAEGGDGFFAARLTRD